MFDETIMLSEQVTNAQEQHASVRRDILGRSCREGTPTPVPFTLHLDLALLNLSVILATHCNDVYGKPFRRILAYQCLHI